MHKSLNKHIKIVICGGGGILNELLYFPVQKLFHHCFFIDVILNADVCDGFDNVLCRGLGLLCRGLGRRLKQRS